MYTKTLKHILLAMTVAFGLAVTGCSTTSKDTSGSDHTSKPSNISGVKKAPSVGDKVKVVLDSAGKPTSNSIYFAYDRSDIEASASTAVLDGYVSWLKDHSGVSVTVEGNCDERGSREYNLALGQARADRVKDYLVSNGVAASRIDTVSFGEERAVCSDSGDTCWAQNRRADIVSR